MTLPRIERTADTWILHYEQLGIGIGFESIKESSAGLKGLVTIEAESGRLLGPVGVDLMSTRSQSELAGHCAKRVNSLAQEAWLGLVGQCCAIVAKQFREPSPTIRLDQEEDAGPVEYLVPRLIPTNETTFIYGDGESGKSLLALLIAVCCADGLELPWGVKPTQKVKGLVLDWETHSRTVASRLQRLCRPYGDKGLISDVPALLYRGTLHGRREAPPLRTLTEEAPAIREQVIREGIGLVIFDSLSFAVYGSLRDDEIARPAMMALRTIPCTKLVVAHISKEGAEKAGGPVDPFGSRFFKNGVRSGFEVRRSETNSGDGHVEVGIYHWKANDGDHVKPFGLALDFDGNSGPIRVSPVDLMGADDLASRATLSARIRQLLKGGATDTKELSESLSVGEGVLRGTLKRMPDVVQVSEGRRGEPAKWGLSAHPF